MKKFLLIFTLTMLFADLAAADEKSHQAAVKEYIEVITLRQLLTTAGDDYTQQTAERVIKNQHLTCEGNSETLLLSDIKKDLLKFFNVDKEMALAEKIYTASYSEDELHQLITFYKSPLGQKKIKVDVDVLTQMQFATRQVVDKNEPEIREDLKKIIAKYINENHQCKISN